MIQMEKKDGTQWFLVSQHYLFCFSYEYFYFSKDKVIFYFSVSEALNRKKGNKNNQVF